MRVLALTIALGALLESQGFVNVGVAPARVGSSLGAAEEPSREDLIKAVASLTTQVEQLSAMVRTMVRDREIGAGKTVLNGHKPGKAATPAASPVKEVENELVPVDEARQRIQQWSQNVGGGMPAFHPTAPAQAYNAPVALTAQPVAAAPAPSFDIAAISAPAVAAPPVQAEPQDTSGSGYAIKLEWEGSSYEFNCDADTTVLEAAMEQDIDLPHSCMSGSCLTCPGIITSGTVDQSDGILEEDQLAKGLMLTCVSYPTSNLGIKIIHESEIDDV
ncbi:unnamed protein product [Chrysoparadoxa australica]